MLKSKSKTSKYLLGSVIAICLAFVLFRFGEFAMTRIPPYSEGKCFKTNTGNPLVDLMQFKVYENHILSGYSDTEMSFLGYVQNQRLGFDEIRSTETTEVKCESLK